MNLMTQRSVNIKASKHAKQGIDKKTCTALDTCSSKFSVTQTVLEVCRLRGLAAKFASMN